MCYIKSMKSKITDARVHGHTPAPGENPSLCYQVRALHSTLGPVQLCFENHMEAAACATFINCFGKCPANRRGELKQLV
jgi:hypothetical protein